jgi:hypothetical protein
MKARFSMTKRKQDSSAVEAAGAAATQEAGEKAVGNKPAHEVRIGRCKAVIWANETDSGVRHNVTVRRLFKREGSATWEQSDSFGPTDLPLAMEALRQAWLWIYAQGS